MGRSVKTNLWRSFAANRQIAGAVLTAILLFAIILTVTFSKGHGQSEVRVPDQNNDLVSVLSGMDSDEWYEKRAELQKNALAANAALTSSFERDGLGNYIWPDSFCGAWIEEEYLVIALKSLDTDVKQGYEKVLTEYTAYVKYVERKYSKNELYALIDKVSEEIKNQYGESIQSYSLLEQVNRIEIGVSQELLTKLLKDGFDEKYHSVIRFTTGGIVGGE